MQDISPLVGKEKNIVSKIGKDFVTVLEKRIDKPTIILQNKIQDWEIDSIESMDETSFRCLNDLSQIEILIIGTGEKIIHPNFKSLQKIKNNDISVEIMDTKSACHTYNILITEGREAVLAILF